MHKRNITLDFIRTLAILLMVVFHFIYDLKYFSWITWNIPDGEGWRQFRYLILSLFFICIGASLVYSHKQKLHLKKFIFRLFKVAIGAALITLMSLVMFPNNWIYFGVLHFIIVASILSIPLIHYPRIALIAGISVILAEQLGLFSKHWPFSYINHLLPHYTTDYVPLFPWLGIIWLGIALAHSQWFNQASIKEASFLNESLLTNKQVATKKTRLISLLALPGKHSLIIYLIHQPLLFALLTPIHWLMN